MRTERRRWQAATTISHLTISPLAALPAQALTSTSRLRETSLALCLRAWLAPPHGSGQAESPANAAPHLHQRQRGSSISAWAGSSVGIPLALSTPYQQRRQRWSCF